MTETDQSNENQTEDLETETPEREPVDVTITDIELEELKEQAKEFKEKYFRLLAEQENTRKRLIKEKEELTQYAIQNVILELLHPLDHLEQALAYTDNMSEEIRHWCEGFKMILTQFKDVLKNHGVSEFHADGAAFDPHLHEAIEMVETEEVEPNMVMAEMRKGYKMGDRTIRPARVKVSKTPKKDLQENNTHKNQGEHDE